MTMAATEQSLTGTVERERISPGSKSEHVGVVLRADDGCRYVLRRLKGNPFRDEALERLVGKSITATGFVSGSTFIMTAWEER